jgi:hypothetical protein
MSQPESPPPSVPAADAFGTGTLPARLAHGVLRAGFRAVRAVLVGYDLRFRPKEPLPAAATELPLPPLFVGGTGRSGTTIVAKILGAHPDYHMIPFEVRFVSDRAGLADLVEGRTDFNKFARRMRDRWSVGGTGTGGRILVTEARQRAALAELRAGLKTDRPAAAARFVHRLLDPAAVKAGASGWIEMTPGNVRVAPVLARCFAASRLAHAVRDGRDVACSVTPLKWGPTTHEESLRWWEQSLEEAFDACARAPEGFVHLVRMERLLGTDRDAELARLLAFAGLEEVPKVRTFFDQRATTERANIGRWRTDVAAGEVPGFLALHAELAARLAAKGYPYVPYDEPSELAVAAEG